MTEALEKAGSLFMLDAEGWVSGVRRVPSPNFDARSPEVVIELVVVHAISLPPNAFGSGDIDRLFTNTLDSVAHPFFATIADLRVSARSRDPVCVVFAARLACRGFRVAWT